MSWHIELILIVWWNLVHLSIPKRDFADCYFLLTVTKWLTYITLDCSGETIEREFSVSKKLNFRQVQFIILIYSSPILHVLIKVKLYFPSECKSVSTTKSSEIFSWALPFSQNAKFFKKLKFPTPRYTIISYSLIRTRSNTYQSVRYFSFLESLPTH